jgi:hypothetical protein
MVSTHAPLFAKELRLSFRRELFVTGPSLKLLSAPIAFSAGK